MFTPSQADVRRFFCQVHAKTRAGEPLEAIETIASLWLAEHPEYHADMEDVDAALNRMYETEDGKTNPFLHLSMHLSISEQCSIDQPRGIHVFHVGVVFGVLGKPQACDGFNGFQRLAGARLGVHLAEEAPDVGLRRCEHRTSVILHFGGGILPS